MPYIIITVIITLFQTLKETKNKKYLINTIRNCDKHYKSFKKSGKETDKHNFKYAKVLLSKILIIRKNFALREKIQKRRTVPKNSGKLWNH